ncbi:hypothetical protein [Corynebacterium mayonis]|uniref:hypothetical protein n=1 Tax=Corynebacterium mayonis TaxID=3062461 RepID=UPI003140879A
MAKLRDFHIDGAHASVQVAGEVAVAVVGAGITAGGEPAPQTLSAPSAKDLIDEVLQHLTHQIRKGMGE